MDGGGRFSGSLNGVTPGAAMPAWHADAFAPPSLAASARNVAVAAGRALTPTRPAPLPSHLRNRRPVAKGQKWLQLAHHFSKPGVGLAMALLLLGVVGGAGFVQSGKYAAFAAENGSIGDIVARSIGLGITAVIVTTDNGTSGSQLLPVTGINKNSSLLFLNAGSVRDRLMAQPLVQQASVRKLYPDRLVIDVIERKPFAIWQKDGKLSIVSADGTPISTMDNDRFAMLPFVVGEGANLQIQKYSQLLAAAGNLKSRIRSGILVSERRWDLKMTNGVDIRLPEKHPERALQELARLEQSSQVLEKDVISLDFRVPDRMIARLSEGAADARRAQLAKKTKHKVGTT
ncbi:MAG: cell division protein FtsQ/DivIB [Hyphomicrobiales bacterium]|nr:cell division protein FtsQ/DivIB [Hyphomicrobiales bacterium]MDE2115915.1 cell division protein FtsQ/DivIB [Hyphomicrobiales bacterium]